MTPEQRSLVYALARGEISRDTFLIKFPFRIDDTTPSMPMLEAAYTARDPVDVELGIGIGSAFGFTQAYKDILCRLWEADWHHSHEDVISALNKLKDPTLVDLFYAATVRVPEYLGFDENRALAIKAIWALGNIGNEQARSKLEAASRSDVPRIRASAIEQLQRISSP
jgi:hypothetical protein